MRVKVSTILLLLSLLFLEIVEKMKQIFCLLFLFAVTYAQKKGRGIRV